MKIVIQGASFKERWKSRRAAGVYERDIPNLIGFVMVSSLVVIFVFVYYDVICTGELVDGAAACWYVLSVGYGSRHHQRSRRA